VSARYALQGPVSGELLTYGGRVLVHDNAAELGFLVPGVRVVTVPRDIPPEQTLPISAHPGLAGVRFPLDRRDFR
jgi:hypothetical protein